MYPLSLDFQTLLDNLDLGIWCVDQNGHFIFENSFFLKTTGYSKE
ncbi:PAS domain S-box protein [Pseudoflavonifractor phocaeensis]|nr:PAS domain S-box protein [Pseudoflavonifractor phocaeensis]